MRTQQDGLHKHRPGDWRASANTGFHLDNEIVGEALVALLHDDLKSMGIASVGHRLTILKSVYDVKKAQDVPIESDHYVPLCSLPLYIGMTLQMKEF